MLRHLSLNPGIVLEVLKMMGCDLGPSSGELHAVTNPINSRLCAVLDISGPMDGEVIEAHLKNLELSPEEFLENFNRFKASFTR